MPNLYKISHFKVKEADEDEATITGVFSTEDEDRHGDVVKQKWDLKNYKNNPVILNSHNYDDAADVVGIADKISVRDGKLQGKIKFAVKENPKAKIIYDLYAGGFLKAFSVGFMPKEWSDKGEILKSELLEISAVSVPANAMALAKSKGINVEKLYESTIPDNNEDEGDDEERDTRESDGSKVGGKEGNGEHKEVKEQSDTKDEIKDTKEDNKVVEEVEEVKENKKVKVLQKTARILGEVSKNYKGRNSDTKSDKAEINRYINQAVRKLLIMKE